jgi:hypothetical protein
LRKSKPTGLWTPRSVFKRKCSNNCPEPTSCFNGQYGRFLCVNFLTHSLLFIIHITKSGRYNDIEKSVALPFLNRPNKLDGSHAGDFGFDPLGFTESYDLYTMQESELRHARLAMLAVIGWPMSELLAPDWMLQNGMAPSVLNGFNPVSLIATALFFGAAGFVEFKTSLRRTHDTELGKVHREDMANVWKMGVAGDYSFDPLGLYSSIGNDASARKGLRQVEISHGRSAMLGITGFAMWEFLTGHPIVENSMFFHPNLLLPALVAAYIGAGQFYEFSGSKEYPLQLELSSEGEARLNGLTRSMASMQAKGQGAYEMVDMDDKLDKAFDFLSGLKDKYDNMNDDYTSNVMKDIK